MRASQALRRDEPACVQADLAHYWREGYAIVRGLFDAKEICEIGAALDQLYAEGAAHGRCFRHGNLFYNVASAAGETEPLVRMVQWPSYHQPVLNGVRLDRRFRRPGDRSRTPFDRAQGGARVIGSAGSERHARLGA